MKKVKVTRDKKENSVQILNFSNIIIALNSKNEISTNVHYKDTSIHNYLPYDSDNTESRKKSIPYKLAKRITVSVTDPENFKLRLNELRIWLKNNKYPDIVSNGFYNANLHGHAPKLENN